MHKNIQYIMYFLNLYFSTSHITFDTIIILTLSIEKLIISKSRVY